MENKVLKCLSLFFFLVLTTLFTVRHALSFELTVDAKEVDINDPKDNLLIELSLNSLPSLDSGGLFSIALTNNQEFGFYRNRVYQTDRSMNTPTISIKYRYRKANNSSYQTLTYQLMDSLFLDNGEHNIKLYLTPDYMWIESKKPNAYIGKVYVAPVHYGLGNVRAVIRNQLHSIHEDFNASNNIKEGNIYTFDDDIYRQIKSKYTRTLGENFPLQDFSNRSGALILSSTSVAYYH